MKDLKKKIRDAAVKYAKEDLTMGIDNTSRYEFESGALSHEAKEYWQQRIGAEISAIINIDGDELTDGECVDAIVQYLTEQNLYIKKK